MKIKFLSGFNKDLSSLSDINLAKLVFQSIQLFEKADSLHDIPNIKKLKGHPSAYRYRKGIYRIGFYVEENTVIFAAFAPRHRIYKKFP